MLIATPLSHDKFKLDPTMYAYAAAVPGEHTASKGNGPPHIQCISNWTVRSDNTLNTDDVAGLRSTRLSVLGTNTAQSEHEGDAIKIDPQFIKAGEFQ